MDVMELIRNQDTDAVKWAQAFCEKFGGTNDEPTEELMVGWFANAMQVSEDAYRKKTEALIAAGDEYIIEHQCTQHDLPYEDNCPWRQAWKRAKQ